MVNWRTSAVVYCLGLALVGCSAPGPVYDLKQTTFTVTIIETDDFITKNDQFIQGEAHVKPGECVIRLRKYPRCLLHEIRHCVEGNWHEGRITTEDC